MTDARFEGRPQQTPSRCALAPLTSRTLSHCSRTVPKRPHRGFVFDRPIRKPPRNAGLSSVGGTGLEPVTPSLSSPQRCYAALAGTPSLSRLCRNLRALPAAAFALVLGFRPPLLLAPVSTARRGKFSARNLLALLSASRWAEVPANRSHRRRRVVEFCHSGGGIWTDINDHVPGLSDSGLLTDNFRSRARLEGGPHIRRGRAGGVRATPDQSNSPISGETASAIRTPKTPIRSPAVQAAPLNGIDSAFDERRRSGPSAVIQQPVRPGRSSGTAGRSTNSRANAVKRSMSARLEARPSEARTAPPEGSPIAST
jgi:hypothetical protein